MVAGETQFLREPSVRTTSAPTGYASAMGDSRRHRGPHPEDHDLFSPESEATLRAAVEDLSWLRTRGYAEPSALKLVGDRYQLRKRQRVAVGRCACAEPKRVSRAAREVPPSEMVGRRLWIDGLNVLTTIEVALSGGVLFVGKDSCLRDMASFHGNYRLVRETERAATILVEVVDAMKPAEAIVFLDRPVSNSGRLADVIRKAASSAGSSLRAQTADGVDETLKRATAVAATADSAILDACEGWLSLARLAVERHRREVEPIWLMDFS